MGELGLAGAVRGKVKRTTISDPKAAKPLDLVDRNFRPLAPDRLWVADFTYVSNWSGWAVATTMTSTFVVDAVEQAIWTAAVKAVIWPAQIINWSPITTTGSSTCPWPTPSTSPPQGSSPRPVPSGPATTTPSPSP